MKMKRTLFLLFSLVNCIHYGVAQDRILTDDTIKVEYAVPFDTLGFNLLRYEESQGFQQYRPFGRNRLPIARSGNLGLPIHSFAIDFQSWNTDHHLGAYQAYLFKKDSLKYYRTSRPFTQLSYANGSESEQLFQLLHTQNIGEGLNISFEYQRITSEGFYIRQFTNHTQFNATYNLSSRSKRFHSRGYYLINALEAEENGGIILTANEDQQDNTILLDINLREGQNRIRSNSVGTRNDYDILADSNSILLNFSHELSWTKSYRLYQDDTTGSNGFYENFFFDIESADSSFSQVVENELTLNLFNSQISLGLNNSQYHYYQNSFLDRSFATNYLIANFSKTLLDQQVSAFFRKGISGFYSDNLLFQTNIKFQEILGIRPTFFFRNTKSQADYLLQNQRTNHLAFHENFETSDASTFQLDLNKKEWKLGVTLGYHQLENYIYYDSTRKVAQFDESISSFYVELNKHFVFFKHWNLLNKIRFQTNDNEEIIPLPNIYSYHSLFYENLFFKKSLFFQVGIDAYYFGEYEGYAYDPSLTQFYNRSRSSVLGNVFQMDVFVNMRVNKSARIFLKMENILSNSFSEETTRIQDFPIPGRALKVGLSWRMFN